MRKPIFFTVDLRYNMNSCVTSYGHSITMYDTHTKTEILQYRIIRGDNNKKVEIKKNSKAITFTLPDIHSTSHHKFISEKVDQIMFICNELNVEYQRYVDACSELLAVDVRNGVVENYPK